MERTTLNDELIIGRRIFTQYNNKNMKTQILKSISLIFMFVSFHLTMSYGQKVMEFNDVKLISGSYLLPLGVPVTSPRTTDTLITIPPGKVWHFESTHTGFSMAPFTEVYATSLVIVSVNGCGVYQGSSLPDFKPFWLPSGSYHIRSTLTYSGTPPMAHYFRFFITAREYNSQP